MRGSLGIVYGVSVLLHAGLAMGVSSIEEPPVVETVRITMRDVKPPPEPQAPEPPPEAPAPAPKPEPQAPKAEAPKPTPEKTPEPAAAEPATASAEAAAAPEFGVSMSGGVGPGGVAVAQGDPNGVPSGSRERVAKARQLGAAPSEGGCAEPESRPRPIAMPQPEYTEAARTAGIEGKVRVSITVDAQGHVRDVRVLESLDPGLDEAALAAARAAQFEPAVRCGSPTEATFTVSIRFTL